MAAWIQDYNPLGNATLSTVVSALPVTALLVSIAVFRWRVHLCALFGAGLALGIAILVYGMPPSSALAAGAYGAAFGLFPVGWIILNLIFLYEITLAKGAFQSLRAGLAGVAPDPRVQLILVAFCFGAFFEGVAGFGTPVAVSAAILIQLGFRPLAASGLSLIANTAPVAFGALGMPIVALAGVTGFDPLKLSAMVGRQLPFFSLLVPFWIVWAMCGWRGARAVWPATLAAGVGFAVPQFLVSNLHGPWLVDVVASISSMGVVVLLLRFWRPASAPPESGGWREENHGSSAPAAMPSRAELRRAWMPWILLTALVFVWGLPQARGVLDGIFAHQQPVPFLDRVVVQGPPVAAPGAAPERAVFSFNALSATGTGILIAAGLAGFFLGVGFREMAHIYLRTLARVRWSLLTIAGMIALGFVTRYSGIDTTLGLAMARTGALYPFFGTLLGWLGVALTGSDTSSNVLFGGLQKVTAEQVGVSPMLMAAANSSGGVMGKMIDAQSIVVASTTTNWFGRESEILRFVFFHSLALAALVGVLVTLQAYVPPFTGLVVR